MLLLTLTLTLTVASGILAQQAGTFIPEVHPKLAWQRCSTGKGCTTQAGSLTADANDRLIFQVNTTNYCFVGNTFNVAICPDDTTCAANCALQGMDYTDADNGVYTSGNAARLKLASTRGVGSGSSRLFLMNSDTQYEVFKLLNQELVFDVDVSAIPCRLNGGLYFLEMDADGGMAKNPLNKAGAKFGTGYCDASCPRDLKFIDGRGNVEGWAPSPVNPTSGTGRYGACCSEVAVWEANSISTSTSLHPCSTTGLQRCADSACGTTDPYSTVCDPDGCDFNPYRLGNPSFFGLNQNIDTRLKLTVVTRFITDDGTATGQLSEVQRIYLQNGLVIQNSKVNIPGIDPSYNSITEPFCAAEKSVFGEVPQFQNKGGLAQLGKAMANGMVLALSIWDDWDRNMLWLDGVYPTGANTTTPGVVRGTCPTSSGSPADLEVVGSPSSVTFSNIRFGDIGSTSAPTPA